MIHIKKITKSKDCNYRQIIEEENFFLAFFKIKNLFIYGCAGSSLLCVDFL